MVAIVTNKITAFSYTMAEIGFSQFYFKVMEVIRPDARSCYFMCY